MYALRLRVPSAPSRALRPKYRVNDWVAGGGRVTRIAHLLWEQTVSAGDCVVDATCGRGRDAVQLAALVGSTGTLHTFDIQQSALRETRELLEQQKAQPQLHMHHESHCNILDRVEAGTASLVAFNLGYLPGADHALCTTGASTVRALYASMQVLKQGGVLSVVTYTGHAEGLQEHEAVVKCFSDLPTDAWFTTSLSLLNRKTAPQLLCAWKR